MNVNDLSSPARSIQQLNGISPSQIGVKAELYNTCQPYPAWIYRKYDCNYVMNLIMNELNQTFQQQVPSSLTANAEEIDYTIDGVRYKSIGTASSSYNRPLDFSNWLLNNFPFDNSMRLSCLKLNCVNQRLMYMCELLKNFTNITCQNCGRLLCSKSDVFSMSKQGFMQAYLNPGGFIHETLTVYKAKNLLLMSARPTTQNSWFPGYGWTSEL